MLHHSKKWISLSLAAMLSVSMVQPALAAVSYMPDVTAEMSHASFWADYHEGYRDVILTQEEITAFNRDTALAEGTMVMDLKTASETYNGISKNNALRTSSTSDAQYYQSWTYDENGNKTDWAYFQEMIDNTQDKNAKEVMPVRYGVAVNRTIVQVFPSDKFLLDDPNDKDSDNMALSAVPVNEPVLVYSTSADGEYYQVRIASCSGWIPVKDVAICADKEEWLSAWDLPSEELLVVYGNKVYTDRSYETPQTSRRMLTTGTALELVTDLDVDQRVGNRSPYHNYVVYLPVREEDGSYSKELALIPETAKVHIGYLPLTMENIAMVSLNQLGDAYGWGGMLDVEDCSGMVRTVYSCFGLEVARNGNWQWNMNMEKIDMTNMSLEEKCPILDEMPMGSALCFTGHEMIYLGKVNGKYYVVSAVGTIMSPDTGKRLNTREVMINTLDVKRANGQSWLQAINQAFMPCYAKLEGKTYDFPEVQWYRDGVGYVLKNSLIANYENGYFGPNDLASREVAVNALWRLDGRPETADTDKFSDVSAEKHYMGAICWANENGIACGYGNGKFGPEDTLTREQMVTILWRYAKYKGYDVSVGEETNILSYDDAFEIAEYAIPAMQWACGSGLLIGEKAANGGMVLNPQNQTTRAQLSMMLMRFDTWMKQAEHVPQDSGEIGSDSAVGSGITQED